MIVRSFRAEDVIIEAGIAEPETSFDSSHQLDILLRQACTSSMVPKRAVVLCDAKFVPIFDNPLATATLGWRSRGFSHHNRKLYKKITTISGATCHMAMPQCCYMAKGAKRPSHTTNTIKFDRIPFDPCNSIKRFDHCPFNQKNSTYLQRVGGNRSKERDRKSELVLRSTYQIFWMGSKQLGSKFLKRSQICSHTPSALNAEAKRSDVPLWPCLNVATWRRERSDRAIQQIR